MPHSNGRIYTEVRNGVTYGVTTEDVNAVLGVGSLDVATLFRSSNINPWARYKPLYIAKSNSDGIQAALTEDVRRRWNYGIRTRYAYDGVTGDDLVEFIDGLLGNLPNQQQWTAAQQQEAIRNRFAGMMELLSAGNMWHRLLDFVRTGLANVGYNHNAEPQPIIVHRRNNVGTLTMGAPIFQSGSTVYVENDKVSRFEIPDDEPMLTAWAKSKDITEGGHTSDEYYTDLLGDCGESMSILEAIQSYQGAIQLTRENVIKYGDETQQYANAERGVAIVKKDSDGKYKTFVWSRIRSLLEYKSATGVVVKNATDDYYYTSFRVEARGSIGAFVVSGTGSLSTTPLSLSEIERLARWLTFGEYDASTNPKGGSGTNPQFGYTWLGSSTLSDREKDEALERAKTAIYKAMISPNGKYIDLTRKGVDVSTSSNLYYSTQYGNWQENDSLNGEVLVVEFYRRLLPTGSNTISSYVTIPSYVYPITIARVNTTPTSVDITDVLAFIYVESDYSDTWIGIYTHATFTKEELYAYLHAQYSSLSISIGGTSTNILGLSVEHYDVNYGTADGDYMNWKINRIGFSLSTTAGSTATITATKAGASISATKILTVR